MNPPTSYRAGLATMSKPRVFISWSKPRSRAVAEALYDWLPTVIQNIETWMSTTDIEKGSKWRQVLSGELTSANFGIICLTPENLSEPWLLFEAGALSKATESRVWTYLYDLSFTDVEDPLSEFQHTTATMADTRRLVQSISSVAPDSAPMTRVDRAFDALWPELETALKVIEKPTLAARGDARTSEEMLKEVLLRVRELEPLVPRSPSSVPFPRSLPDANELIGHSVTRPSELERRISHCDKQVESNMEGLRVKSTGPTGTTTPGSTEAVPLLTMARARLRRAGASLRQGDPDTAQHLLEEAVSMREKAWEITHLVVRPSTKRAKVQRSE